MTNQHRNRRGRPAERRSQIAPANVRDVDDTLIPTKDTYGLLSTDLKHWADHFGAEYDQVRHDYVISRVMEALALHRDMFVFYGGTALSRTILSGLRLSEDIDLLSNGPRRSVAASLDQAVRDSLVHRFGEVTATPHLDDVRKDTDACVYHIGGFNVQIQLIDGTDYAPWPRQLTSIEQRYQGIEPIELVTYTQDAFAGAKTSAWCERNAPRDLYDLWGLSQKSLLSPSAAETFRRCGFASAYPQAWMFPMKPPTQTEWDDALRPLCVPLVGPQEAYETVVQQWQEATKALKLR